jgi:hypothetical protein
VHLGGTSATFSSDLTSSGIISVKGTAPFFRWLNSSDVRLAYIQHNATNLVYNADTGIHVFNQAIGLGSNTTVLGNLSTTFGRWWGNLLIGDSTNSGQPLQVTGNMKLTGTLTNGTYTYTLPSATGTLALTSNLSAYLPLAGGTLTGALGGTSATFSSDLTSSGIISVKGTAPFFRWLNSSDVRLAYIQHNATNLVYNADTGIHVFNQAATFSGNVGIGLASPAAKLDVLQEIRASYANGNQYRTILSNTDGNGRLFVDGSDTALLFGTSPSGTGATATEKMRITSSGNVGIGTTSPTTKLTVVRGAGASSINGISDLVLDGSSTTGIVYLNAYSTGNAIICNGGGNVGIGTVSPTQKLSIGGVGSAISFDTTGAAGTSIIQTVLDYELSIKNNRGTSSEIRVGNENLSFFTNSLNRLQINTNGNVGIGTTSPNTKLTVATTDFPGVSFYRDLDVLSVGSAGQRILIGARKGSAFTSGASITAVLESTGNDGNINFETLSGSTLQTRLSITSAGNVLIGTTTDNGAKLQVNGTISMQVTTATTKTFTGNFAPIVVNGSTYYIPLYN